MFTLPINHDGEDLTIHFVHHRSSREGAIPLLFQHGWPGNFLEVERIIDELVEPKEGGQAYHVVAPSLPGFVFSEMSMREDFGLSDMAHVDHKLMIALGYETYMVRISAILSKSLEAFTWLDGKTCGFEKMCCSNLDIGTRWRLGLNRSSYYRFSLPRELCSCPREHGNGCSSIMVETAIVIRTFYPLGYMAR